MDFSYFGLNPKESLPLAGTENQLVVDGKGLCLWVGLRLNLLIRYRTGLEKIYLLYLNFFFIFNYFI